MCPELHWNIHPKHCVGGSTCQQNQSKGEVQKPQNGLSTQICIPRTFTEHGEITKMPQKQARHASKTWAWKGPSCKTWSFRKRCSTKPDSFWKFKSVLQQSQLHNEHMLAGMFWKSSKLGHLLTGMQDLSSTCLNLMIPLQGNEEHNLWTFTNKRSASHHPSQPTDMHSPPHTESDVRSTPDSPIPCDDGLHLSWSW